MSSVKKTKYDDYELKINFPIFSNWTIYIVIGETLTDSVHGRYGWNSAKRIPITADAYTMETEGLAGHCFFTYDLLERPMHKRMNPLVHECWHAVRHMLQGVGVSKEADELDNEVVAYHLGHTVERAAKFLEEVRNDRNKSTNQA